MYILILKKQPCIFCTCKVKDSYISLYSYHSDSRTQGISRFGQSSTFSCHKWHGHRLYALCSTGGGEDSTEHVVGLQAPF